MSSASSSHDERPLGAEQRASAAAREQWHFVDYLRLISKRRWTAIPAFVVIVAGTVAMTSMAIPIFEARAQLLIEAETQNVVTFKEVVEQEMTTVEYYTTQFRILQSRALARTTIERLKLWDHPELIGNVAVDSRGWRAGRYLEHNDRPAALGGTGADEAFLVVRARTPATRPRTAKAVFWTKLPDSRPPFKDFSIGSRSRRFERAGWST